MKVFDGHNDVLLKLSFPKAGEERDFFEASEVGHIDMPRSQQGDFAGGFFAIFPPPLERDLFEKVERTEQGYKVADVPQLDHAEATRSTMKMLRELFDLEQRSEGGLKVVRSVAELEDCLDKGVMAAILHFEGAEAIDTNLDALYTYYQAGLRSLGLAWSRKNDFAQGVPFHFPSSPDIGEGLTDAGKALVKACNELGIMLDLSHLNEAGFWDVAKLSDKPLVATHSNVHALCPTPRNLTDKQLEAIGERDGMVGLNFAVSFLREDGARETDIPLSVMLRHIDYLVEKLGIDRVGFGSDFDGTMVADEIADVRGLPKLVEALREHGYDEEALEKLCYKNWLRVLGQTWRS